jgi:hypothetical protein
MCSYRARRNFKGEKTTTSVGPNLLPAIRIDSGSTSTENTRADLQRVAILFIDLPHRLNSKDLSRKRGSFLMKQNPTEKE